MRASTTIFALASIFGLSSAIPTPVDLAPRCGTTVFPTFLQQISEAYPSNIAPTSEDVRISQTVDAYGVVSDRVIQIAVFENIPASAFGCQLNVQFPSNYVLSPVGAGGPNPALNVSTLFYGEPEQITYANAWTWDYFFPTSSPPFGLGLFGTVTLEPGQNQAINSETCEGSLAFAFEIAPQTTQSTEIVFTETADAGFFLTHSC